MLDKSSLDTKYQEERDRSIMVYNVLESSAENGNKLIKYDVSFINYFVPEGCIYNQYILSLWQGLGNMKEI